MSQRYAKRANRPRSSSPNGDLRPTPLWFLVFISVLVALACFLAIEIWLNAGKIAFRVPFVSFLVPLVCAGVELWLGWRVRSYQRGHSHLSALAAGVIFVCAQAGSRAGAILVGSAVGMIAGYAHVGATSYLAQQMFHLAIAAVASLALVVASYVAERWCVIRDDGTDDAPGGTGIQSAPEWC